MNFADPLRDYMGMAQSVKAALDARKDRQLTYHTAVADLQRAQRNLVELKTQVIFSTSILCPGAAKFVMLRGCEIVQLLLVSCPIPGSHTQRFPPPCAQARVNAGRIQAAEEAIAQTKLKQEEAKEQLDIVHKRVVAEMKRFKVPALPHWLSVCCGGPRSGAVLVVGVGIGWSFPTL